MGKQGYNGRSSKNFRGGSNPHMGASRSQSGSQSFGYKPPTRQPKRSQGPSLGEIIFGPGPRNMSHGGKKKKR